MMKKWGKRNYLREISLRCRSSRSRLIILSRSNCGSSSSRQKSRNHIKENRCYSRIPIHHLLIIPKTQSKEPEFQLLRTRISKPWRKPQYNPQSDSIRISIRTPSTMVNWFSLISCNSRRTKICVKYSSRKTQVSVWHLRDSSCKKRSLILE